MKSSTTAETGSNAVTMPWICLMSIERSGTNQVATLLEKVSGLTVFYEIFLRPAPSYARKPELKAFSRRIGGPPISEFRDPRLADWVHENVSETFDVLEEAAGPNAGAAFFKLFEHHLTRDEVREYVLKRPGMHVLVVQRRPIDAYISRRKASANKKWIKLDTTKQKAELDLDDFLAWHERSSSWFDWIDKQLAELAVPHARLSYEADIAQPEPRTIVALERALEFMGVRRHIALRKRLRVLAEKTVNGALTKIGRKPIFTAALGLPRQDRSSSTEAKAANWDEFVTALAATPEGTRRLEEYFVTG